MRSHRKFLIIQEYLDSLDQTELWYWKAGQQITPQPTATCTSWQVMKTVIEKRHAWRSIMKTLQLQYLWMADIAQKHHNPNFSNFVIYFGVWEEECWHEWYGHDSHMETTKVLDSPLCNLCTYAVFFSELYCWRLPLILCR